MSDDNETELDSLVGRIGRLTQTLLEDGADPSQVVFALTSVAADMGLQISGDPLKVFPVLLNAIADQASRRVVGPQLEHEEGEQKPPHGTTVH